MDRIKKLKIKKQDGTFSDYIPIGADAENIDTTDGESVQLKLNKKPYYYNTVADMKADTKLKVGDMAITLGYYEVNDGGAGLYKIVNDSSLEDDIGNVPNLENGLKAVLIVENEIDLRQLGFKSGDDISDIISDILDYFSIIRINEDYTLSKNVTISNKTYFNIICNPKNKLNSEYGIEFVNCNHFKIYGLRMFDTYQRSENFGIKINNSYILKFERCHIDGYKTLLFLMDYGYAEFDDCFFIAGQDNTSYGLYAENYFSEQLIMNNCKFDGKYESPSLGTAIFLRGSILPTFNNCDITNWTTLVAFNNIGGNLKGVIFNTCQFSHCKKFIDFVSNNETQASFNNCNFDTTAGNITTETFINNYYGILVFEACNHISSYGYELINSTRNVANIVKMHFLKFDEALNMTINIPEVLCLDFTWTSYGLFAQTTERRFFAYNFNHTLKAELLYTNNPNYDYQFNPYSQWTGSETRLYFAEQPTSEAYLYVFKVTLIK